MTSQQQSLLTLKAIISENEGENINKEFLIEKIDICMFLIRPQVLLSEKGKRLFDKYAVDLANKGKIIYKPKGKVEVNVGRPKLIT